MLKLHFKYITLLLVLSITTRTKAQEKKQENRYAIKMDTTIHNKWIPTGIRLGVDIASPIYHLFKPTIANYEGAVDVDFDKFFLAIEMGKGSYISKNTLTNYTNNGFFYRIGADVNMTAKDTKLNVFYFGLRYATSTFNESLAGVIKNDGWGTIELNKIQSNAGASWVEMNMGVRIRIINSIFMGYALRLKFLKHNFYNEGNFDSYFIPGYGIASNSVNFGINYYIQYRIEWRKKPIFWKKK